MNKESSDYLTVSLGIVGIVLTLLVAFFGLNVLVYAYMEAALPVAEATAQSAFDPVVTLAAK